MIRKCQPEDIRRMYRIINQAATGYRGIIPADCYHQPYMPLDELQSEMKRMSFYGWEENDELTGIMGLETIKDTTLIRHAYVLPEYQKKGIGSRLLNHLRTLVTTPSLLVGTWADAYWALDFYKKQGFKLMPDKNGLLQTYWDVSPRQIDTSVVLGLEVGEKD